MPRLLLCLAPLLLFHLPAQAAPVGLDLWGGPDGSFNSPYLHKATRNQEWVETDNGWVDFYKGGKAYKLTEITQATAHVTYESITFLGGEYQVGGGFYENLKILGGTINFYETAEDEFGDNKIVTNYGSFYVLDRQWVNNAKYAPNTYAPHDGYLSIWANNWDTKRGTLNGSYGRDYVPGWGLDYVVHFDPIPEPGTAMLVGGGLLALGARRRRAA